MLLWIRNLGFSGGGIAFFVSVPIPVQYEATIIINGEPVVVLKYGAVLSIQYAADIFMKGDSNISVRYAEDVSL